MLIASPGPHLRLAYGIAHFAICLVWALVHSTLYIPASCLLPPLSSLTIARLALHLLAYWTASSSPISLLQLLAPVNNCPSGTPPFPYYIASSAPMSCPLHGSFGNLLGLGSSSSKIIHLRHLPVTSALACYNCPSGTLSFTYSIARSTFMSLL